MNGANAKTALKRLRRCEVTDLFWPKFHPLPQPLPLPSVPSFPPSVVSLVREVTQFRAALFAYSALNRKSVRFPVALMGEQTADPLANGLQNSVGK